MLFYLKSQHPDSIREILQQYPVTDFTWIVSDLKSKQDLQNICLNRQGYYTDENILRISDFWQIWLRRLAPKMTVASNDFIQLLVEKIVGQHQDQMLVEKNQSKTLHNYIRQLAPLLLSGSDPLQEWLVANNFNNPEHRWYKWYKAAQLTLFQIIEQNVLESSWISAYLQNLDLAKIVWPRPLVIDLGSQMTSVEMGLLNTIAKSMDVYVITPVPEWKSQFQFLLNTYDLNAGFAKVLDFESTTKNVTANATAKDDLNTQKVIFDRTHFLRFSTQLAEVKWLTLQVRKWLDKGVKPGQIALLSSRAEQYWPLLSEYLHAEGIPTQKPKVTNLISLGFFQKIIARIKNYTNSLNWESLESIYADQYAQGSKAQLAVDVLTEKSKDDRFEKFKALFYELTEPEDLSRDERLKAAFYKKIDLRMQLSRDEFLAQIYKVSFDMSLDFVAMETAQSYLSMIFKDIIGQSIDTHLSFQSWFDLFCARLSRKEIKIQDAYEDGVQIRSFGAVYLTDVTHRVWFGLDDSAFASQTKSMLPLQDIEVLKRTFDVPLSYPEESHEEFNLRWLCESQCREQFFTCSHVGLQAEPLTTSQFILEHNSRPDVLLEGRPYLDSQQIYFLDGVALKDNPKILQEKSKSANIVKTFNPQEFSGTDLIHYADCQFKLLASKGFRLRDYPIVSVDLDHLQKGTLVHALFEFLIKEKRYLNIKEEDISTFLEEQRLNKHLFPAEDLFWSIQKNKLLKTGLRFAEFEKRRLTGLPLRHETEKDFRIEQDGYAIVGRIDRVDYDTAHQEAIIYDYKKADSNNLHYGADWVDENEFQLLFYLLAEVEQEKDIQKVKGALYYFYQKLQIFKGALVIGNSNFDQTIDVRKLTGVTQEDLKLFLKNFESRLSELFGRIKENSFLAKPKDVKICDQCDWRRLCRAEHLQ